ncbi:MAG: NepR family anti-sigma factor [Alphaproteobacteria bacterium]
MNSSDDGEGPKPATTKNDAAKKDMTPNHQTGGLPTPTDNWWDGQLKALYQSVLDEPLPDDMIKLVQAPKHKTGDVKAKGFRKPEDE